MYSRPVFLAEVVNKNATQAVAHVIVVHHVDGAVLHTQECASPHSACARVRAYLSYLPRHAVLELVKALTNPVVHIPQTRPKVACETRCTETCHVIYLRTRVDPQLLRVPHELRRH